MARPLCSLSAAAALVAAWGVLASTPSAAQFFNPLEALFGPPPRPQSNVPYPPRQQVPQQQSYPGYPDQRDSRSPAQPYPGAPRQGSPGVQSEPLPPPPGSTASVDPRAPLPRSPGAPQQGGDTAPQPGDEIAAEPPAVKIENKNAMFSGLDKITGRIINFDAAIGETVQFGALQVTPRICYTRPPTETPNTDAFLEVDEVTLQGEIKRIFTGWVFAASPGLHAVEHPIYDVWLTDCKNPVVAAAPPPAPEPAAAPPSSARPATTQARRPPAGAARANPPALPR
jgi:hypothetical protein